MKNRVRLSQCMIVKNEEKNIRRALSWAKEIAFEQIVVDTGSTDHTVEIAEEMGRKCSILNGLMTLRRQRTMRLSRHEGNGSHFWTQMNTLQRRMSGNF